MADNKIQLYRTTRNLAFKGATVTPTGSIVGGPEFPLDKAAVARLKSRGFIEDLPEDPDEDLAAEIEAALAGEEESGKKEEKAAPQTKEEKGKGKKTK